MLNEDEGTLKLENLATRFTRMEEENKREAADYLRWAAEKRAAAMRLTEGSEQRIVYEQQAAGLAEAADSWTKHAAWAGEMAQKLRNRARAFREHRRERRSE